MRLLASLIITIILSSANAFSQDAADWVKEYLSQGKLAEAEKFIPDAVKENWKDIDFILLCGDIYFELEKYDKAVELYAKADDLDGGEPEIMVKYGTGLSFAGQHNKAIKILKDVVEDEENNIEYILALARAYLKSNSTKPAQMLINRAKSIDDQNPDAFIALGDLYFAGSVFELAKSNYEEALSLDEDNNVARERLATSYYWLGARELQYDNDLANEYFSKSLNSWQVITQKDPSNARAFYNTGKIYFLSKKFKDAAMALYQYSRLRPDGILGRWYLAQSLYEVAKCDSAAPHLIYVSENLDSVKVKARLLLGRCYFENEDFDKAKEVFLDIKQDTTLDYIDMQRLGNSAWLSGDTLNAIEYNKETIRMYPDKACSLMDRFGRLMIYLKNYDDAIDAFKLKLETSACEDSTINKSYYFIGVSYFQSERADSALPFMLKSIELDSTYLTARLSLADIYASLGKLDTAIMHFEYVVNKVVHDTTQYNNELLQALNKLCGMQYEKKAYNDVIKYAKMMAEHFPDKPFGYLWSAFAYFGKGDNENACSFLRKTVKVDPQNASAKKYLKEYCSGG